MLKTFMQLLGDEVSTLWRYLWLAVIYGLLCGLAIVTLIPIVSYLLIGDVRGAAPWLIVLLVGVLVCWVLRRYVEQAGIRVGVVILQGARHRLGDHVARLPVGWFTPQNTARLGHVVTQGMMTVAQLPAHVFTPVIAGVVTPVVLIAALFLLHWSLGLIALVALPVLAGIFMLTAKLARHADEAFQQRFADASQRVVEFAQAQSVLRAFNGEGGSTRMLEQAVEEQHRSGKRLIWLSAGAAVLNVWVVQAVFAVLLLTIGLWVSHSLGGELTLGEAIGGVAALMLVSRFIDALLEVAGYSEVLRGAGAQLDAIRTLFAVQLLPEPDMPQAPQDASIALHDVSFRYAPDTPDVLCGVNVQIKPGSMTAFIGESGSGKTTLMKLISRFFEVSDGSVCVGNVDVRQMSNAQLAGQISQIFQENYLFTGTIADNIKIGKPNTSDADLMRVIQQTGVAEIIARLPEGLDTQVGEGGARLSGGERQRIAIARALIKDAPILLVDEATAALDAENQAVIAETLARLRGQRTLVVIAHQLSTIAMADQIVVFEAGRVVEQGTPDQLLAHDGHYKKFLKQRMVSKGWRIA
jgi:ATP-binding cassette subfamily B protein IrtB